MRVHRIIENRFDCLVTFEPPNGTDGTLVFWRLDKGPNNAPFWPKAGDMVPLHFDARNLYLITR